MARPSPGARRVATVLEFLAARPEGRFTLSELARGCDLNKATAHALLSELTSTGLLLRHPEEKRYSLGPRLVPIGEAARLGYRNDDFRGGPLRRLALATGAPAVALALSPHRDQATVIECVGADGRPPLPVRWPLTPPNGAVFFAWADEADVHAWLARSPVQETVQHAVEGLEAARRHGVSVGLAVPEWQRYVGAGGSGAPVPSTGARPHRNGVGREPHTAATRTLSRPARQRHLLLDLASARPLLTDLDEVTGHDVAYVAAPVFDCEGTTTLALAVGWPGGRRCTVAELRELADEVRRAADAITAAGHGHQPDPPRSSLPGDGDLPDPGADDRSGPSGGAGGSGVPGRKLAVRPLPA